MLTYKMQYLVYFFLIITPNVYIYALDIDENSSNLSILDKSSIFIDKTNTLSLEQIKEQNFSINRKSGLNFGYNANITLWIKFTLTNKSTHDIKKILLFDNYKTESVILYTQNDIKKGGFHYLSENHRSITPSFVLKLPKGESRTYFVQTMAKSKSLKAKLSLWNSEDFIKHDAINIIFGVMFLGMFFVLLIYNLMILLFTKDKAYFYYVLYLLALILFNTYYSGFLPFYLLSPELASWSMKLHMSITPISIVFAILFTKEILHIKEFKKLHITLNTILFLLPIFIIMGYNSSDSNTYLISFYIFSGLTLLYSGLYTLYKGIREAKYYIFAWTPIVLILSMFTLQSYGLYDLKINLNHVSELAFVFEALLFSIALAHRINITNEEKALVDAKLIAFQKKEKEHLNILVSEKTNELKHSLNEKEILYKELNHRVKNNFMMILSLLKLQISRSKLTETKNSLHITKNRIQSIANLYEMLLLNSEDININTQNYLKKIYDNVSLNFQKDIEIEYNIQYDIQLDSLIYVGLVFNELVTNSFKYAFPNNKGKIFLLLKKEENKIFLNIKDNGQGFKERRKNSLGLTIVQTLIEGQLLGTLVVKSDNGTEIIMSWNI